MVLLASVIVQRVYPHMLKQSLEQKVRECAAFLLGVKGGFVFPYVKCFK